MPPIATVPAKANGDPEAHDAEMPEIVAPLSDRFPVTLTLKSPFVFAEPEMVSPEPLGPAVDETAIPTTEFV